MSAAAIPPIGAASGQDAPAAAAPEIEVALAAPPRVAAAPMSARLVANLMQDLLALRDELLRAAPDERQAALGRALHSYEIWDPARRTEAEVRWFDHVTDRLSVLDTALAEGPSDAAWPGLVDRCLGTSADLLATTPQYIAERFALDVPPISVVAGIDRKEEVEASASVVIAPASDPRLDSGEESKAPEAQRRESEHEIEVELPADNDQPAEAMKPTQQQSTLEPPTTAPPGGARESKTEIFAAEDGYPGSHQLPEDKKGETRLVIEPAAARSRPKEDPEEQDDARMEAVHRAIGQAFSQDSKEMDVSLESRSAYVEDLSRLVAFMRDTCSTGSRKTELNTILAKLQRLAVAVGNESTGYAHESWNSLLNRHLGREPTDWVRRDPKMEIPVELPPAEKIAAESKAAFSTHAGRLAEAFRSAAQHLTMQDGRALADWPPSEASKAAMLKALSGLRSASLAACADGQWDVARTYDEAIGRFQQILRSIGSDIGKDAALNAIRNLHTVLNDLAGGRFRIQMQMQILAAPPDPAGELRESHRSLLHALASISGSKGGVRDADRSAAHKALTRLEQSTEAFAHASGAHAPTAWINLHNAYRQYMAAFQIAKEPPGSLASPEDATAGKQETLRHQTMALRALDMAEAATVSRDEKGLEAGLRTLDEEAWEGALTLATRQLEDISKGILGDRGEGAMTSLKTLVENQRIAMLQAASRGDVREASQSAKQLDALRESTRALDQVLRPVSRFPRLAGYWSSVKRWTTGSEYSREARAAAGRAAANALKALTSLRDAEAEDPPQAPRVAATPPRLVGQGLHEARILHTMNAIASLRALPRQAPADERARVGQHAKKELLLLQEAVSGFAASAQSTRHYRAAELAFECLHSAYQLYRQTIRDSGAEGAMGDPLTGLTLAHRAREAAAQANRDRMLSVRIGDADVRVERGPSLPFAETMPERFRIILAQGLDEQARSDGRAAMSPENWDFLTRVNELELGSLSDDQWRIQCQQIASDFGLQSATTYAINFGDRARRNLMRELSGEPFNRREAAMHLLAGAAEVTSMFDGSPALAAAQKLAAAA